MPPRSNAFVTAMSTGLCGLVGLMLGGCGIDLVRIRRRHRRRDHARRTRRFTAGRLRVAEPLGELRGTFDLGTRVP